MLQTKIAIVGDYDPAKESHQATDAALQHAAAALDLSVQADWIPTEICESEEGVARLETYDGVFLGPGAPYRSQDGALAAVRFTREQGWPFFST
jgi:CTP synthase (UTP-ammonia lyase)